MLCYTVKSYEHVMERNTVRHIVRLAFLLLLAGSNSQAFAAVAASAAPTTISVSTSGAASGDAAGDHAQCVLGALICLHADMQPYLVTTLWLLFLAVLLLVFERSELPRCVGGSSPSEPSLAAPGSNGTKATAAAAKARERRRRWREFCNKVCIQGVREYLPTSCLQILLGLVFAGMVQISGYHVAHLEEIEPDLFFRFLLPIIIINAGLGVEKAHFFFNLPAILAYAVLGTIFVALAVGYAIYGLATINPGPFTLLKNVTKIEALTFGALISAVDPVAVLAVFERMHLNKPLYITLFGESVLNDAVSVVLYNLLTKANASMPNNATEWRPTTQEVAGTALYSVHVAVTGLLIGAACGFLASGLLRFLPNAGNQHLAVIIVVVFGYIAFYLAEFVAASGILSTFVCAIVMSTYFANLTPISYAFLRQSTKSYAEISEGFIYLVLGVSALTMLFNNSSKNIVDVPFIFVTLVLCLVLRFACVYGIGYLLRALHLTELRAGDFFILAYGGLRGAIALSLSLMLEDQHHRFADVFLTCTMVMVLLTCFIYGITLKPLIKAIKIQADDGDDEYIFDQIKSGASDPLRHRPLTKRMYHWFERINDRYLKRALLKSKVYHNDQAHIGSMLKVTTESDSLEDLNVLNSNSSIYVIRKGSSRSPSNGPSSARGSRGDLDNQRTPHETPHASVIDMTGRADISGTARVRGNPSQSQSQQQNSARPQVHADSRLSRTPPLPTTARNPGRAAIQPRLPPLELLSANTVGAKYFVNTGYRADETGVDEAAFLESQKLPNSRPTDALRQNGGNHRPAEKYSEPADPRTPPKLNAKASSPPSSGKSGNREDDDQKRQKPRGSETEV